MISAEISIVYRVFALSLELGLWVNPTGSMKVELEMYIEEDQESIVMEKVLVLTKKAEELGFRIVETEVEGGKDEEHEERQEEREEEESKINEI